MENSASGRKDKGKKKKKELICPRINQKRIPSRDAIGAGRSASDRTGDGDGGPMDREYPVRWSCSPSERQEGEKANLSPSLERSSLTLAPGKAGICARVFGEKKG